MATKTLVVGFGVTGQAVGRYLTGTGGAVVVAEDAPTAAGRRAAGDLGVDLVEAPDEGELEAVLAGVDQVVPSPGVPVQHPVYRLAGRAGIPVRSEIELGWRRLAGRGPSAPKLVAITGTNGKTTVTSQVTAIMGEAGARVVAAGNIGLPLVEAAGAEAEVIVAEVSSFQLQFTDQFRPAVSCWLNLADDHLDWHPSRRHYAEAKARIWAAQGQGDVAVLNAADAAVMEVAGAPGTAVPEAVTRVTFSGSGDADYALRGAALVGPGPTPIMAVSELRRALPHDLANALAACATAVAAGATPQDCRTALGSFETLPHRVELIGEAGGVGWYDDSKATTPASVLAAVAGFDSVVLIAGGRNKGIDLSPLASAAPPVHAVVAIGEAAPEVVEAFAGRAAVTTAASMADAVAAAAQAARPGDAVLLSPGCASFDWYDGYAARGEHFSRLVRARIGAPRVES